MSDTILELQGTMRAGDAAGFRAAIAEALVQGDVQVATDGLVAIDAAVVQVLLSALHSAAHLERNLQITIPDGGAFAIMRDRLALGAAFVPSTVTSAGV
jgi:anti-anti-sigma regulatory factor